MHRFELIIVSTWHGIDDIPNAMRQIGFRWLYSIPRPAADCWEFYCCDVESIVDVDLPSWIRCVDIGDVDERIGCGLTKEMADGIKDWIAYQLHQV